MFFAADAGIEMEQMVVDILAGEQYGDAFAGINPSNAVPVLEDDGFRMTEASAILKYLAEKMGSPAYPSNTAARARINEVMDWCNTSLYRTFGYGLVYPQILEPYQLPEANAQRLLLQAGEASARRYLGVLNDHWLGNGNTYLAGPEITIADYFASGIISLGEVIGCTFADWPNLQAWYGRMKSRPNWQATNGAVFGWAEGIKGPDYVRV
jgi:glutathione S-transferase